MKLFWSLLIFYTLNACTCFSQDFHELITKTYGGFVPHELTRAEINKKIPELDSLFNLVKSDTLKYFPLLKNELQRDDNPKYFYYDFGHFLFITSKDKQKNQIFINSLRKADIRDLNQDLYWKLVRYLALRKYDITDLALKILEMDKFEAYIPEHAFGIDKDYVFYYFLIPLESKLYVGKLIKRYSDEKSLENQKIILRMLWRANNCIANDFLKTIYFDSKTDIVLKQQLKSYNLENSKLKVPDVKLQNILNRESEVYNFITDYTIREIDDVTKKKRKYLCISDN